MFNPTQMQFRVQGQIKKAIGGEYSTPEERRYLEQNRSTFNYESSDLMDRFVQEFGGILGDKIVKQSVKIDQKTQSGYEDVVVGQDKEGGAVTQRRQREYGVTTIDIQALEDILLKRGMNRDEFQRRSELVMQPTAESMNGVNGHILDPQEGSDGAGVVTKSIKGATVEFKGFNEEVKKTAHNQTLMYKFGDALRGISWRFASLSLDLLYEPCALRLHLPLINGVD